MTKFQLRSGLQLGLYTLAQLFTHKVTLGTNVNQFAIHTCIYVLLNSHFHCLDKEPVIFGNP
jgi:hypothetical protein